MEVALVSEFFLVPYMDINIHEGDDYMLRAKVMHMSLYKLDSNVRKRNKEHVQVCVNTSMWNKQSLG